MKRYKLGDILTVKHGFPFKGEYFSSNGKYIVLTPGNFYEQGGFKYTQGKEKYYLGESPAEYICSKGDLIVAMTEQTRGLLGSTAIVPEDDLYLHNQRIGLIKFDASIVDKNYLNYLFRVSWVRSQLESSASGTKIKHTSPERICDVKIHLPPLSEQRKIGSLLSFIDKKISLNNRVDATLEAMAKTLYDYWFVQFDFPDEKGRPYKTSGGKMVYNEELGREIPEGWEVLPLHDICTVISGYPFDSSLYDTDGDYHILTIKNIQNGYIVPQTDSNIHEIPNDIPAVDILKIGDILMSLTGNVGRVGILCGNNYLLNQRAAIVQPQFDNIKWFLYFMFRNSAICMQIQNISTGTSQKNVSPIDIGNIKIPYADRYMQNFNDTILSMVNTIIARTVESQKLAALRDWLLPMLMNGQVGFR